MIAIKNLQWLHELLTQEELIRAIAALYTPMVSDARLKAMLDAIVKTSEKNSDDIIAYLKTHQ